MTAGNPYFKVKNLVLSPTDIELDVYYAITINPDDTHQCFTSNTDRRLIDCRNTFIDRFCFNLVGKYIFYTEVSKLGRVHYHGKIKFMTMDDVRKFYLTSIHKLTDRGTINLEIIKDWQIENSKYKDWDEYMTKEKSIWKQEPITERTKSVNEKCYFIKGKKIQEEPKGLFQWMLEKNEEEERLKEKKPKKQDIDEDIYE